MNIAYREICTFSFGRWTVNIDPAICNGLTHGNGIVGREGGELNEGGVGWWSKMPWRGADPKVGS